MCSLFLVACANADCPRASLKALPRTGLLICATQIWGGALSPESSAQLVADPCDLVFVIADGLSASAVSRHTLPLLDEVVSLLDKHWSVGPVCIVEQGRVAIGDAIGFALPGQGFCSLDRGASRPEFAR